LQNFQNNVRDLLSKQLVAKISGTKKEQNFFRSFNENKFNII
jgi:hypothetical protein